MRRFDRAGLRSRNFQNLSHQLQGIVVRAENNDSLRLQPDTSFRIR